MTQPDNKTKSQNPIPVPVDTLPPLPDSTDAAELMEQLNLAASYYWRCKTAFDHLAGMNAAERETCPGFRDLIEAARSGMAIAWQRKELAASRLEALNSRPASLVAWPERRRFPRPDFA